MTKKRIKRYADITETNQQEDDEEITGNNCPVCGYPTVREYGLELCYHCGWSEGDEPEGYFEE